MKAHLKLPDLKISACTIAKNEEKSIARSINSYKDYVDEIIVVDTGSTDNTVKIAEELGAKVLHFEWCNDFSAAKNVGIDAATGDWLICLDADEYFADDTCKNLRDIICEAAAYGKNAVGCRMENIDIDTGDNLADAFSIRVIQKGTRYRYAIHEEIYNPNGVFILTVEKTNFYLKHTGYSNRIIAGKGERNLKLMLDELKKETDERRIITYYSYISDSYYGMGKLDESVEYAQKFIKESNEKNVRLIGCEIRPYLNIIQCFESKEAEPWEITPYVEKFLQKFPDCPDAHYSAARDFKRRFMFGDALREFKKALEISEDYSGVYLNTVVTLKAILYNYCGMCNESMLNASEAMKWYFKAYDEENEFYQSALYNLLRIVRKMPEQELNSFVESLYKGVSDKKHLSVLSALMCNYMSPQLVKCYAAYRSDKKDDPINADVSAFIMAGEGKYEASANMFFMYYNAQKDNVTLMRTYLCATFSQNDGIIHNIRESCNPVLLFLFFNEKKPELKNTDISTIATFFIECNNIGHSEFALKKLDEMAELLCDKELLTLSRLLAERFFFEASFKAARKAEISANSIFMQGFCLFGMHRLFEATDLLLLARHLGYSETVVDELMSRISTLKNSEENNTGLPELKQKIMSEMESGNFENACSDINIYKRSAESDADILTAEAALLYYTGDYKAAAIAAECGLLKNEKNADLLYNAGCIYQKIGNPERAEVLFRKAIENCTDLQAKAEIEQELKTL